MSAVQIPAGSLHGAVPDWVWALALAAGIVATFTDLRSMRIPNWLTLPLLAAGLAYGASIGGWSGLGNAALGCAVAGAIFIAAYAIAGGGAGDAKLMMALGAWVGLHPSVVLVLSVTICGAICAIGVTMYRDGIAAVPVMLMHGVLWTRLLGLRFVRNALTGAIFTTQSVPVREEKIDEAPKPPPKGWFPYAPSILAGTAVAWWYWQNYGSVI